MKPAKLVVLAMLAAILSISVPTVSFFGFGAGSGLGFAADTISGVSCSQQISGSVGCLQTENYDIWVCNPPPNTQTYTWVPSSNPNERDLSTLQECNNKCAAAYGTRCITSSGSGTTTGNSAQVQITPSTPEANTQFTITFILSSPLASGSVLKYQIQGQPFIGQLGSSNCVGNSCTGQVSGMPAGTYNILASIVSGGGQETGLSLNPSSVTIGYGQQQSNQCCVTRSGDTYSYRSDMTQQACINAGARFYPTNCANAENTVCADFCRENPRRYTAGGTCGFTSNQPNPNMEFSGVCQTGSACKCNSGGYLDRQNVACNEACLTDTRYAGYYSNYQSVQSMSYIPVGTCTANPQAFIIAAQVGRQTGVSGGAISVQPFVLPGQPGSYQCPSNEYCVCNMININTFSANTPSSPVLPGTRLAGNWPNPNDISDTAPTRAPNEHKCDTATNATITATIQSSSKLILAGDLVTITGKVEKLSDTCLGYTYTCTKQGIVGCEEDTDWWLISKKLKYKECPANLPKILHEEGSRRSFNWEIITGGGALLGCVLFGQPELCAIAKSLIGDGVYRQLTCSNGQVAPSVAPFIYSILSKTGQQPPPPTPLPTPPPGGQTDTCSSCIAQGISGMCLIDGRQDLGYCTDTGPCPAGTSFKSCAQQPTPPAQSQYPLAYSTRFLPDPAIVNTQTAIIVETPGAYDAVRITFTTAVPTDTISYTLDETDLGVWSKAVTFTNNKLYSYEVKATTLEGPIVRLGGGTLNVITTPTGAVTANFVTGQVTSFDPYTYAGLSIAGNALPVACPTLEQIQGCFRVCGKTYQTEASFAPKCLQGGPVVGYKDATYKCSVGSCGGFANKKVKIEVRGPTGAVAISDTTTTDSDGSFSYTFNAPAADGQFTAIVSVPKD